MVDANAESNDNGPNQHDGQKKMKTFSRPVPDFLPSSKSPVFGMVHTTGRIMKLYIFKDKITHYIFKV